MKRAFIAIAAALSVTATAAQPSAEEADSLIRANDFYALERLTPDELERLPETTRLMTDAVAGSRFNRLAASCDAIQTLLNEHIGETAERFGEDAPSTLFSLLLGNLRVMGEYESAAQVAAQLRTMVDDDESRLTLDGMIRMFEAHARHPRTAMAKPDGDITVPLRINHRPARNALGDSVDMCMLTVDVDINGRTEEFIFDTGCSQSSFVSDEFARRNHVRILCDSIRVGGAATAAYASIGVLDSMRVGPVTLHHPTFIVMPPNQGTDSLFKINAVLGTDFMALAGELRLYPDEGKMVIPAEPTPLPASGRNLALDVTSGNYTLLAECDGEPVVMGFDTGSRTTTMSTAYFAARRGRIEREGRPKEVGVGGFGGISRGTGYEMPSMRYTIGGCDVVLPNVTVHADIDASTANAHDGWLGIDALLPLKSITINFDDMFVTAESADRHERDGDAAAQGN